MGTYGQFSDAFHPIMDGVGVMVQQYALWQHRHGHRVVVVAPRVPGYAESDPFQVIRTQSLLLPPKKPYRLQLPALSFHAKRELRQIPLELVHAHSPASAGGMALQTGRQREIPVVTTFHSKLRDDFEQVTHSRRLADAATALLMRHYAKADAVWTVSDATARTLRSYGYQGQVDVIPNATDLKGKVVDRREAARHCQAAWGIPPEVPLLLYVGQMAAVKNPMLVISAAARILREGSPCHLVLAGEGAALPSLRALAQQEGIRDRVHFTGVLRDRDQLATLYRRASLFVFPSRYDNAPLVLREAAAMDCPALLVAGSNAAEGMVHGANGFLAPGDTLEAYTGALREALADPARLEAAGRRAEETLAFSWESIVSDVEARYLDIIRAYRARPRGKRLSLR